MVWFKWLKWYAKGGSLNGIFFLWSYRICWSVGWTKLPTCHCESNRIRIPVISYEISMSDVLREGLKFSVIHLCTPKNPTFSFRVWKTVITNRVKSPMGALNESNFSYFSLQKRTLWQNKYNKKNPTFLLP